VGTAWKPDVRNPVDQDIGNASAGIFMKRRVRALRSGLTVLDGLVRFFVRSSPFPDERVPVAEADESIGAVFASYPGI
jgi:hypothetical protein